MSILSTIIKAQAIIALIAGLLAFGARVEPVDTADEPVPAELAQ